jgi:hypothetical protein
MAMIARLSASVVRGVNASEHRHDRATAPSAPLLDSRPMERSMERWKRAAILVAILLTAGVVISLYAAFLQLILQPAALIGSFVLAAVMGLIILRVALVPSQRHTSWVRALVGPNGRWLFLLLILLWIAGMAFLASLGLNALTSGAIAFPMLFVGVFLFMGFIWSVVGE